MNVDTRRQRRVAIVEDDRDIALSLTHNLKKGDLHVQAYDSGEEFLAAVNGFKPDCVVLDLGLPGIDGLAVCRELRQHPVLGAVPILILTARVEEAEKLLGFELGADDYVTKPFSVRELTARLRALLRRGDAKGVDRATVVYEIALPKRPALRVDCGQQRVFLGGKELRLTRKELELLRCLIEARGLVVSRDALLQGIWGYDFPGETRTVDVHITRLRKKVGNWIIETVVGSGYRLAREAVDATRVAADRS